MTNLTPVPDAVLAFKARLFPERVAEAVKSLADAQRSFQLCRTPLTYEAREYAISDMARATKILATVPTRNDSFGGAA